MPGSFQADLFDAPYPGGSLVRQAGDHPFEQRVNFDLNGRPPQPSGSDGTLFVTSHGALKTAEVTLPRGMIGNPEATPKCDPVDFSQTGSTIDSTGCPANTQVGYLNISMAASEDSNYGEGPYYIAKNCWRDIQPGAAQGHAGRLRLQRGHLCPGTHLPEHRPRTDYAIKALTPNISTLVSVLGSEVTFWGVPGDPVHDKFRYYPKVQEDNDVREPRWGAAPIRSL